MQTNHFTQYGLNYKPHQSFLDCIHIVIGRCRQSLHNKCVNESVVYFYRMCDAHICQAE